MENQKCVFQYPKASVYTPCERLYGPLGNIMSELTCRFVVSARMAATSYCSQPENY